MKLHLCDLVIINLFFPVHAQGLRRAQISASCVGPALVSLTVYTTEHCCKLLLIDYLHVSSDVIDYLPVFDDILPSNHPIASPNFFMCRAGARHYNLRVSLCPSLFTCSPCPFFCVTASFHTPFVSLSLLFVYGTGCFRLRVPLPNIPGTNV